MPIVIEVSLITLIWQEVNFEGSNLFSASFKGANLFEANLTGANITNAVFEEANLSNTIWVDGKKCALGSVGTCD